MLDWVLFTNDLKEVELLNKEGIFNEERIVLEEEYGKHVIDRINKIWKKEGVNNSFVIDCVNKTFKIMFDGKELIYDIDVSYIDDKDSIKITYSYGDEVKVLNVRRVISK